MQVLGCDVLDGDASQLNSFRTETGVTYPLLLKCYGGFSDPQNFTLYYDSRDHFAVIDQRGVIRYNAALLWPYGNGYHLNEIRAVVDTLLAHPLAVEPPGPHGLALAAGPVPVHGRLALTLTIPAASARTRVTVLDLAGRAVATLWDGPAPAGERSLAWDARGAAVAPGVYLVRLESDGLELVRRIVVTR